MSAPPPVCLIIWLVCAPGFANAADNSYCKLYSREMVRAYIRTIPTADLPNITVDGLAFQLTRYWTLCLNRDEPPVIKDLPTDGEWTVDIWSQIQRTLPHPAGSVPATDRAEPPVSKAAPPPPVSQRPPPSADRVTAAHIVHTVDVGQPQGLCSSHGMKTAYSGRSWRCLPK